MNFELNGLKNQTVPAPPKMEKVRDQIDRYSKPFSLDTSTTAHIVSIPLREKRKRSTILIFLIPILRYVIVRTKESRALCMLSLLLMVENRRATFLRCRLSSYLVSTPLSPTDVGSSTKSSTYSFGLTADCVEALKSVYVLPRAPT